jgi:hypothetical protein
MNSGGSAPADVGGEPPNGRAKGQRASSRNRMFRGPLKRRSIRPSSRMSTTRQRAGFETGTHSSSPLQGAITRGAHVHVTVPVKRPRGEPGLYRYCKMHLGTQASTGTQTYLITIQTHQHTRTTGRRPRGSQRLRYTVPVHRGQSADCYLTITIFARTPRTSPDRGYCMRYCLLTTELTSTEVRPARDYR